MILKAISIITCIILIIFDLKYIFKNRNDDEIKNNEFERKLLQTIDTKQKITILITIVFILAFAISLVCIYFNRIGINTKLCDAWAITQFLSAFVTLWCTFDDSESISYKKEKIIISIIYLFDIAILIEIIIRLLF